jgi:glycolate oxidase FAD binding subunit
VSADSTLAPASIDELRDIVLEGVPMRIVGAGTWLDAGRPVDAERVVELGTMSGLVEYTPGDLTLTARAGTTLGDIAATTAAERQWLALDPYGTDAGTIGATIATASAGPLAHAFGRPRDLVLGVEAVTGTGAVVHGGGRVVKNVAGFDLTRALTGSWGTLGILTKVTVRLHALPAVDETFVIPVGRTWREIAPVHDRLAAGSLAPIALNVVNAALARSLDLGVDDSAIIVRLAGNARSVKAQRAALGPAVEYPSDVWRGLRSADGASASVFRCSDLPTRIGALWDALEANDRMIDASPGRGVVRCIGSAIGPECVGTVIGERLPSAVWPALGPGPASDLLSRDLRAAFDPARVLNPGIFGHA